MTTAIETHQAAIPDNYVAEIDGVTAGAAELAPLAFAGFAHFTAIQVRGGAIRGLDLHLARLRGASSALYGKAHADTDLRAYLRDVLSRSPADLSLTLTAYPAEGEFTPGGDAAAPRLLIRTAPATDGPTGPLRLMSVAHERDLPAFKHVGEIGKTHHLRGAVAAGFQDAAFVDRNGHLSEATIWNLVFWDGEAVVWPKADMLVGTTMGVVRRQLSRLGVAQREAALTPEAAGHLAGAAVMNSWSPGIPVSGVDAHDLPPAPGFIDLLHRAWRAEPLLAP